MSQFDLFGASAPAAPPVLSWPRWKADHAALCDQLVATLPWEQRQLPGSGVLLPRLECWASTRPGRVYQYSGIYYYAQDIAAWPVLTRLLAEVNEHLAGHVAAPFDAVFANYYRNGRDSIGWHRDDEPSLGPAPEVEIASLSVGARRRFKLRQVSDRANVHDLNPGEGDLLLMGAGCQSEWEHAVTKTTIPVGPRVGLTFRRMLP